MKNEMLFETVDEFTKNYPPPYFSLDIGDKISMKKLKNACDYYAFYDREFEKPLFLIDGTSFRSAKMGILFTNKNVYYRLYEKHGSYKKKHGKISLEDIKEISLLSTRNGSNLYINGENKAYTTFFANYGSSQKEAIIVNRLFKTVIDSFHSNGS